MSFADFDRQVKKEQRKNKASYAGSKGSRPGTPPPVLGTELEAQFAQLEKEMNEIGEESPEKKEDGLIDLSKFQGEDRLKKARENLQKVLGKTQRTGVGPDDYMGGTDIKTKARLNLQTLQDPQASQETPTRPTSPAHGQRSAGGSSANVAPSSFSPLSAQDFALYDRVLDTCRAAAERRINTTELRQLMPQARDLFDACIKSKDLNRAATLAGMLLLPQLGLQGEHAECDAILAKLEPGKKSLTKGTQAILNMGAATFYGMAGRSAKARTLALTTTANSNVDAIQECWHRAYVLRTHLDINHGLTDRRRVQLQLKLAYTLCQLGQPMEARRQIRSAAAKMYEGGRYNSAYNDEALACLEVEANIVEIEGRSKKNASQIRGPRRDMSRAIELLKCYKNRYKHQNPQQAMPPYLEARIDGRLRTLHREVGHMTYQHAMHKVGDSNIGDDYLKQWGAA